MNGVLFSGSLMSPPKLLPVAHSGPNPFDKVSNEMIIQVFLYLPKPTLAKVAQTCQRFYSITLNEVFWRRLDLGLKTLGKGRLGQILARGVHMMRAARVTINSPAIMNPSLECKLQYLDLSVASIQPSDLEAVIGSCKNLRKLSLEMCQVWLILEFNVFPIVAIISHHILL